MVPDSCNAHIFFMNGPIVLGCEDQALVGNHVP